MKNQVFSTKGAEIEIEAFHPGSFLLEEIEFRQIQKKDFAKKIGISINNLNHIFAGERDISTTLATKIGNALGTSNELWQNMQSAFNSQQTTIKKDHVKIFNFFVTILVLAGFYFSTIKYGSIQ